MMQNDLVSFPLMTVLSYFYVAINGVTDIFFLRFLNNLTEEFLGSPVNLCVYP